MQLEIRGPKKENHFWGDHNKLLRILGVGVPILARLHSSGNGFNIQQLIKTEPFWVGSVKGLLITRLSQIGGSDHFQNGQLMLLSENLGTTKWNKYRAETLTLASVQFKGVLDEIAPQVRNFVEGARRGSQEKPESRKQKGGHFLCSFVSFPEGKASPCLEPEGSQVGSERRLAAEPLGWGLVWPPSASQGIWAPGTRKRAARSRHGAQKPTEGQPKPTPCHKPPVNLGRGLGLCGYHFHLPAPRLRDACAKCGPSHTNT